MGSSLLGAGIGESDEDEGDVLAWEAMRLTTDADDGPSAGPASRRNGAPSLSLFRSLFSYRMSRLILVQR